MISTTLFIAIFYRDITLLGSRCMSLITTLDSQCSLIFSALVLWLSVRPIIVSTLPSSYKKLCKDGESNGLGQEDINLWWFEWSSRTWKLSGIKLVWYWNKSSRWSSCIGIGIDIHVRFVLMLMFVIYFILVQTFID